MTKLTDTLKYLGKEMQTARFLERTGLGNDLAFYIVDYDPADELTVRGFVRYTAAHAAFTIREINVFQAVMTLFTEEVTLKDLWALEDSEGSQGLWDAVLPLLEGDRLAQVIADQAQEAQLVFLTGIGTAYPLVRSHMLLNRLHHYFARRPVILFFPGRYTGTEMSLFGLFTDDHYYRALRIEPLVGEE